MVFFCILSLGDGLLFLPVEDEKAKAAAHGGPFGAGLGL